MYLILIDKLGPYGAERVAMNLANSLAENNSVKIITYSEDLPAIAGLVSPNVQRRRIRRSSNKLLAFMQTVYKLRKEVGREEIDTVLSFMPLANSIAAISFIGTGIRVVGSEHNIPSMTIGLGLRGFLLRTPLRLAYRQLDRLICVSNDVRNDALGWYKIKSLETWVVYNPIDFASIEIASEDASGPEKWRECYPDSCLILVVGALKTAKNHRFLLDVLAGMDDKKRMVLVGDGPLRDVLGQRCKELGISSRVDFIGTSQNPYGWMKHADVLAVPSLYEGFGLVLVEAASLDTPVVASDRPGVREIAGLIGAPAVSLDVEQFRSALEHCVRAGRKPRSDLRKFDSHDVAAAYEIHLKG